MHAYWAFSFVLGNIEVKQDYKMEWLKEKVKNVIRNVNDDIIGKIISNDEFLVETIIDPVINIFSSYGTNPVKCLAINYGVRCWKSSHFSIENLFIKYPLIINAKILFKCLPEPIIKLKKPEMIFYGLCDDHSYVQEYFLIKNMIIVGPKPHDNYIWVDLLGRRTVDSEYIYNLFPKNHVTLPSKETSLTVDNMKILMELLKEFKKSDEQ